MTKYETGRRTVDAVYDYQGERNPLIDAMPDLLTIEDFNERIANLPKVPIEGPKSLKEIRRGLSEIDTLFIPLDFMYYVYTELYSLIQSTYLTRKSRESIERINSIFKTGTVGSYLVQAKSGSLLGTAGLSKTTTIKRSLGLMPQVICHEKYASEVFFTKQVLYLFIDTPADCSIKSLCFNIVSALDDALGTNNIDYLYRMRSTASSSIASYVKILCINFNVGLIVVDEIQNLVSTAKRNKTIKPLIRFLTELTNDSSTAIYFSGLQSAEEVFSKELYLNRRTRGLRLLPFKPDGVYREFLSKLWPYQYTEKKAVLTDEISGKLYDYSAGIPAFIIRLFQEAQNQVILLGEDRISVKSLKMAAETLSIKPPNSFSSGTPLSDFSAPKMSKRINDMTWGIKGENSLLEGEKTKSFMSEMGEGNGNGNQEDIDSLGEVKRLYANKRGRKSDKRDSLDLLIPFEEGKLPEFLQDMFLVEVI